MLSEKSVPSPLEVVNTKNGHGCRCCGHLPFLPLGALLSQRPAEKARTEQICDRHLDLAFPRGSLSAGESLADSVYFYWRHLLGPEQRSASGRR